MQLSLSPWNHGICHQGSCGYACSKLRWTRSGFILSGRVQVLFFQKVLSFLQKQVREEPLPAREEGVFTQDVAPPSAAKKSIAFIDAEISASGTRVCDLGAFSEERGSFHSNNPKAFLDFIAEADFVCGHNILRHDLALLEKTADIRISARVIDTLPLSPLLFPKRPYHSLLKDDKLRVDELNNPVSDCKKAARLFHDEVNAFRALPSQMQDIYCGLLKTSPSFAGFFAYLALPSDIPGEAPILAERIRSAFAGRICARTDLAFLVAQMPEELAYALALIGTGDPTAQLPQGHGGHPKAAPHPL